MLASKLNNDIIYQLTYLNNEVEIVCKINNIFYSMRILWTCMFSFHDTLDGSLKQDTVEVWFARK